MTAMSADEQLAPTLQGDTLDSWAWVARARAAARRVTAPVEPAPPEPAVEPVAPAPE